MKNLLLIVLFIGFKNLYSQCDLIKIKGRVVDTTSAQAFYNLMLINKTTNKGVFGKPDGTFDIDIKQNDTLVISVSGYERIYYTQKSNRECLYILEYILKPKVKQLKEVVIQPLKTIQQIKEERENLTLKETKKSVDGIAVIQSPITALYERYSKRARTEQKINKLKYEDKKHQILKELLSLYVAYEIVNLDEKEFDSFISFLNLNDEILKNTSDLELATFIKDKFEHFNFYKQKK